MPDMQIAVLIPCYDEEMTIEKVITDWRHALPEATIYVYDNNSDDRTAEIALKAGVTVGYEPEKGKGNVIRRMFEEIQADCYILTDGDDTYPETGHRTCYGRFGKVPIWSSATGFPQPIMKRTKRRSTRSGTGSYRA